MYLVRSILIFYVMFCILFKYFISNCLNFQVTLQFFISTANNSEKLKICPLNDLLHAKAINYSIITSSRALLAISSFPTTVAKSLNFFIILQTPTADIYFSDLSWYLEPLLSFYHPIFNFICFWPKFKKKQTNNQKCNSTIK